MLLMILFTMPILGCKIDEVQLAKRERQVEETQRQATQTSATAQALVTADARSREELVKVQKELLADQRILAGQRQSLAAERQEIAAERQRTPLLAAALHGLGILLLSIVVLGICGLLLRLATRHDDSQELVDTLVLELAGETHLLTPKADFPGQKQVSANPVPAVQAIEGPPEV
jgi:hypothetical protein